MIPIMKNEKVSLTKCSYVRLFLVQLYKDTKDTIKKTRVRLNIRLLMEGLGECVCFPQSLIGCSRRGWSWSHGKGM